MQSWLTSQRCIKESSICQTRGNELPGLSFLITTFFHPLFNPVFRRGLKRWREGNGFERVHGLPSLSVAFSFFPPLCDELEVPYLLRERDARTRMHLVFSDAPMELVVVPFHLTQEFFMRSFVSGVPLIPVWTKQIKPSPLFPHKSISVPCTPASSLHTFMTRSLLI